MDRRVEFYRHDLGEAELASLKETFATPFLTLGPRVGVFEKRLEEFLNVPHCVGVASCTHGMHLLLKAFGIGEGDEVITTPMTFVATPNVCLYVGAKPVFVDCERSTGLMDPAKVEAAITPRTKAILCVHLYGQMCDMRALRAIADKHGLRLIEDSAHGFECERDGVVPGQLSDAAAFSFYATKTITSGDGGAIVTRQEEVATHLKRLRNHGITKDAASRYGYKYTHWDMVELGHKAALTDIQASLLLPQVERAMARRQSRQDVEEQYRAGLANVPGIELLEQRGRSTHHLFTILVEPQDAMLGALCEKGVGVAVNYRAVHTLSFYRDRYDLKPEDFPNALEIGDRTISLPMWPGLPAEDIRYVCDTLAELMTTLGPGAGKQLAG